MNILKQTLMAAALGTVAMGAQATPFYIDLAGTGVGNGFADATNSATATADAEELTIKYQSHTAITLTALGVSVGDDIHTTGGYTSDGYTVNAVTGLNPSGQSFGFRNDSFTMNTLDWGLTYNFNLFGDVASLTLGGDVADVTYHSGTIEVLLVKFDGLGAIASTDRIMDLVVTGSDLDNNSNLAIFGTLDFTGVAAAYVDMFNTQGGASCVGDITFDGLAACNPPLDFSFTIDQNLNLPVFESLVGNILTIGGNHDGSLRFDVPEPGTLLLLGSALFGMAGTARRRKAK
ncbi:MAG: hypothetical protein COB26_02975 [Piscirickettsiaceae bacterium]|nr:MAG: hypothetical protein COB26_02975 [Piscirickettsiaceae bacterium]